MGAFRIISDTRVYSTFMLKDKTFFVCLYKYIIIPFKVVHPSATGNKDIYKFFQRYNLN